MAVLLFQKLTFPEVPLYLGEWGHLDPAEENLKTFRKLLLWGETSPHGLILHPLPSSRSIDLGVSSSHVGLWLRPHNVLNILDHE